MDKSEQNSQHGSTFLALLSAGMGVFILWATWFFYKGILQGGGFHWFDWIQSSLLVLAGGTGLVAAALLAVGKSAGRDMFKLAISFFPIILCLRLFLVLPFVVISKIAGWGDKVASQFVNGTLFEQFEMKPLKLIIGVGAVIAILALASSAKKSEEAKKEEK